MKLLTSPLTFGTSHYDWRAAIGLLLDSACAGAILVIQYGSDLPAVWKHVAIGVLVVAAIVGKAMTALGKPVVVETPPTLARVVDPTALSVAHSPSACAPAPAPSDVIREVPPPIPFDVGKYPQ